MLYLERTGTRLYSATNGDVSVPVGDKSLHAGVFNPGELLKIALAGCAAMSADATLAKALGDDVAIFAGVSGESDKENNLFPKIVVEVLAAMDSLTPEERDALIAKASNAIDKLCTVGRTIKAGAEYEVHVRDENEQA